MDKETVVGINYRKTNKITARIVWADAGMATLKDLINENFDEGADRKNDGNGSYKGTKDDRSVMDHSVREYVQEITHINGMESSWRC